MVSPISDSSYLVPISAPAPGPGQVSNPIMQIIVGSQNFDPSRMTSVSVYDSQTHEVQQIGISPEAFQKALAASLAATGGANLRANGLPTAIGSTYTFTAGNTAYLGGKFSSFVIPQGTEVTMELTDTGWTVDYSDIYAKNINKQLQQVASQAVELEAKDPANANEILKTEVVKYTAKAQKSLFDMATDQALINKAAASGDTKGLRQAQNDLQSDTAKANEYIQKAQTIENVIIQQKLPPPISGNPNPPPIQAK